MSAETEFEFKGFKYSLIIHFRCTIRQNVPNFQFCISDILKPVILFWRQDMIFLVLHNVASSSTLVNQNVLLTSTQTADKC